MYSGFRYVASSFVESASKVRGGHNQCGEDFMEMVREYPVNANRKLHVVTR
jgi:hypothetical protein